MSNAPNQDHEPADLVKLDAEIPGWNLTTGEFIQLELHDPDPSMYASTKACKAIRGCAREDFSMAEFKLEVENCRKARVETNRQVLGLGKRKGTCTTTADIKEAAKNLRSKNARARARLTHGTLPTNPSHTLSSQSVVPQPPYDPQQGYDARPTEAQNQAAPTQLQLPSIKQLFSEGQGTGQRPFVSYGGPGPSSQEYGYDPHDPDRHSASTSRPNPFLDQDSGRTSGRMAPPPDTTSGYPRPSQGTQRSARPAVNAPTKAYRERHPSNQGTEQSTLPADQAPALAQRETNPSKQRTQPPSLGRTPAPSGPDPSKSRSGRSTPPSYSARPAARSGVVQAGPAAPPKGSGKPTPRYNTPPPVSTGAATDSIPRVNYPVLMGHQPQMVEPVSEADDDARAGSSRGATARTRETSSGERSQEAKKKKKRNI